MKLATLFVATLVAVPGVTYAQSFSGGGSVQNRYLFDDALVANDEPVVMGDITVNLTDELAFEGFAAKGLTQSVGDEVDVGASYTVALDEVSSFRLSGYQYILKGLPDLTDITAEFSYQDASIGVSRYLWSGGFENGWRVRAQYNAEIGELAASPFVLYETGLEGKDILLGGVEVSYPIWGGISAIGTALFPITGQRCQLAFGLSYRF